MNHWIVSLIAVFIGFNLDLIFGDPHKMPHLVRLMGKTITKLETIFRKIFPEWERMAGLCLVIVMLLFYGVLPYGILFLLYQWCVPVGFLLESFVCYQMLAAKSLRDESMKVYDSLKEENILKARKNVSMIVGRDTESLDKAGIIRAAVETVAENTSDGVIAPLFYMVVGGGALGMAYKAVNTMDSMTGYRNERYIRFGFFPAKLDDVVNIIPSRLAALLMIVSAGANGYDAVMAAKIFKRDRYRHKSPNSAQTESVCAGALHIRLAGNAYYFGKLYEKPYIGEDLRPVEADDIICANRLMMGTAFLALVLFGLIKLFVILAG